MGRRPYPLLGAVVFTLLLLLFLYSIAEVLLLLFIAVLFAIYLSAITDALQQRLAVPRTAGLLIAVFVTLVATVGVVYLIVPPVVQQSQELIQAMPALMARWEEQLRDAATGSPFVAQLLGSLEEGESYTGSVVAQIGGYFRGVVPYVFSGFTFVIHFISVLVMGIYLALRPSLYQEGFILLAPPIHRELVRDILGDLGRTLRAWLVGQILAMVVLGVLTWIGLELLGVPYALAFGVFTGAVAIVPFFGTLFSTLLPAVFVLGTGGPMHAFWVILLGLGVHAFEANIVAPMIMERQVHLPPVLSILAVLIMAHLLHLVGLLVAVPVLAVVMVVGRRVYVHRVLEGKGFRRAVRDRPVELRLPDEAAVLVHPVAFERSVPTLLES
ncbi:MAG TPA: AI-2E family transporter [Longimicrobiales bacterium]|nr:AI-2E family transporter [Longimicrobiales bacterium]